MRKFIRRLLFGLTVIMVIVLVALPLAVPPLVEHVISAKLTEFGLFPHVSMSLGYCWRNGPGIDGSLRVALVDSPWRVKADFGASCSEWAVRVVLPETRFDNADPVLRSLLERQPMPAVSNLVFSGSVGLDARAERTFRKPVPVWSAKVPIRNLNAAFESDGKPVSITGLTVTPGVSGIADHYDITPMLLRTPAIDAFGFALTNFHATIRASERALMVTEASGGFCGGTLNIYSLFLDPKKLSTGFTLFLDDIEAGEALAHVKGFHGEASGRLHGKIRMFVKEKGKALRLGNAFLYSTPGEIGKIQMTKAEAITDNLAMAGIDESTRANVANALTDLDYSVLKVNLKRNEGNTATLTLRIGGSATRNGTTAPVDITINFNGELEQLLNTGLGYSALLKGKK